MELAGPISFRMDILVVAMEEEQAETFPQVAKARQFGRGNGRG